MTVAPLAFIMVSFDDLPDDILREIFCHLTNRSQDFLNFTLTCRRVNAVANTLSTLDAWIENRPLVYNFYLDKKLYKTELCKLHRSCTESHHKSSAKCELERYSTECNIQGAKSELTSHDTEKESVESSDVGPDALALEDPVKNEELSPEEGCYYHRMFAMLTAKHRNFSTLKLKNTILRQGNFTAPFRDSALLDKALVDFRSTSIVELELVDCPVGLGWLSEMVKQLHAIRILTFNNCCFIDPPSSQYTDHAKKALRQLRIIGDRTFRMSDSIFMYFAIHYPAVVLDVTATRIEFHKRVIKRFYPKEISNFEDVVPSEYILSFPVILHYLKRNCLVTKRLIADKTNMTVESLKVLKLDQDLKNLEISHTLIL